MVDRFHDRRDGARALADTLEARGLPRNTVVLALPRGGVPVGFEVAQRLGLELDVFVVRKLGFPGHAEYAMGALASGGVVVLNPDLEGHVSRDLLDRVTRTELAELERREQLYRADIPMIDVTGRPVLLVDDGLATGTTMRAAVEALHRLGPTSILIGVPVAARESCAMLRPLVDDIVCPLIPDEFLSVSLWYDEFPQTRDDEVRELLARARDGSRGRTLRTVPALIDVGGAEIRGDLAIPSDARGVVVFAHGSGSSRHSPRNRYVAEELNRAGLATLLCDLLTTSEEQEDRYTGHLRFNIGFLADRLVAAVRWASQQAGTRGLPIGLFGASTGAGAALMAAAARPNAISAVVSRGGRPDLAGSALPLVRAPTLLIVGSADPVVVELNEQALAKLSCPRELEVVPGATHLFEEPGTLESVARLASAWFTRHLVEGRPAVTTMSP